MGLIVLAMWLILTGLVALPATARAEAVEVRWRLAPTCHVLTLSVDVGKSLDIRGVDDQCGWGALPVWGSGQLVPGGGATLQIQRPALFFSPPPEIHITILPTGQGTWCTTVGLCGGIEWR